MPIKSNIILFALILTGSFKTYAQSDTSLYIKTILKHEIVNGRNTARKFAIKQEMRNSKNELFREVYINEETKKIDSTLYYYYNTDNTIKHIEKVDEAENVFEYYIYKYKKGKLSQIQHFNYNLNNNSSTLIKSVKIKLKKNIKTVIVTDSKKKVLQEAKYTFNAHGNATQINILKHGDDSVLSKNYSISYIDTLIKSKTEQVITKGMDTLFFYHIYSYNENNQLKSISTSSDMYAKDVLYETGFDYFPGGSLKNKKTIALNNFYIENLTFTLKVYHRDLPTKEPIF